MEHDSWCESERTEILPVEMVGRGTARSETLRLGAGTVTWREGGYRRTTSI
jgi:hypothetical protein